MQPSFKIVANDQDITSLIRDRFISLTVSDSAGEESDTATITIDNRDNKVAFPETGATLDIYMSSASGDLVFKGVYEVDELEEPLDSYTLTISAKAAKMKSSIKAPKSAVYDDVTFGGLVSSVAAAHGYESSVSDALASTAFAHIDQVKESDMALLTRLAADIGATIKPIANRLVAVPRGESKSVSGQDLPTIEISDPTASSGSVTILERNAFAAVMASWFDEAAQETKTFVTSGDSPCFEIAKPFANEEAATAAATAKLKELKRGRAKLSLTRPLSPDIVAEGRVVLSNHKASANGEWLVDRVTHTLESDSYASSVLSCVTA